MGETHRPTGPTSDGKTATLQLSDGCHPTERSWMEITGEGLSNKNRWIIGKNLINAIRGALLLKLLNDL
ncbi:unnamed protein product [Spirodela intermedia]|uniref:Uncharacterized protein n=1 Tax=Spirodela intermedia TaxID=51605 RepID=A0A7I8KE21_SPIIN|nr:unnamed protein product [Spirodela intermedia]